MTKDTSVSTPTTYSLPLDGYVRISDVLKVFPVSRTSWYDGMKAGVYPRPVKLGSRAAAWAVDDIRALLERVKG